MNKSLRIGQTAISPQFFWNDRRLLLSFPGETPGFRADARRSGQSHLNHTANAIRSMIQAG